MTTTHTVSVPKLTVDADKLGYFRFGPIADGIILSNEYGEWHHLSEADFRTLLAGNLDTEHADYDALASKGFLREQADLDQLADAMRRRKRFVGIGPQLHVIALQDGHGTLSVEVAKEIVDHAMLSTSSTLTFRLVEGDEPVSLDLLQFFHQYSTEKNRYEGKALTYELVSSLTGGTPDLAKWIVDKRFRVRTAVASDGQLDDNQRAAVALLGEAATAKRRDETPVTVDMHVGADHASGKEVVEALVQGGVTRCRLVPVLGGDGAIDAAAFAGFYTEFVDALLASNQAGKSFVEELTAAIVHKALRTDAVSDPTMRSPSGGGIAAYDTAGHIFPSADAAALHAEEDDMFLIGKVGETSYKEAVTHGTRRALVLASTLETLPGWADHWSTPFLGVDPVASYAREGDLFPKLPTGAQAIALQTLAVEIFTRLIADDEATLETLQGILG